MIPPGDPRGIARLIPESGDDPGLRDEANARAMDRIESLVPQLERRLAELATLRGERDYQARARRVQLKREHRELYRQLGEACRDFEIGMEAACLAYYRSRDSGPPQ